MSRMRPRLADLPDDLSDVLCQTHREHPATTPRTNGYGSAPKAESDRGTMGQPVLAISLPWPPSTNKIWRHVVIAGSPRVLTSREGREYREAARRAVMSDPMAFFRKRLTGQLAVRLSCFPPDNRRRDLDNLAKAVLDALTHAGVWEDDSQIDLLQIERVRNTPNGRVSVTIQTIPDRQKDLL